MSKYTDYKVTTWIRAKFNEEVDLQNIIKDIEQGAIPPAFDNKHDIEYENLTETEEFLPIEENDNQPTIEVYEDVKDTENWQECIWDNVNKFKTV